MGRWRSLATATLLSGLAWALTVASAAGAASSDDPPPPPLAGDGREDELAPPAQVPQAGPAPALPRPQGPGPAPPGAAGREVRLPGSRPPRPWALRPVPDADSEDAIARALALEAAWLPVEAQAAWRRAARAGIGDRGVEAGRRADAIAELEQALTSGRAGRHALARRDIASALQTLRRQQQHPGWTLSPALAAHIALAAAGAGDAKTAAALAATARQGRGVVALAGAEAGRRGSAVQGLRCLGGFRAGRALALLPRPDGGAWIAGAALAPDDEQAALWQLDAAGRTLRVAAYGAEGGDAALAMDAAGTGAWLVGRTAGAGGSDALFVRTDADARAVAQSDLHLGGHEQAIALARDHRGQVWALVEGEVGDPAGPHRAYWLVALADDGAARDQARLALPRLALLRTLAASGDRLVLGGARAPGEAGGGAVLPWDPVTRQGSLDDAVATPGPLLALAAVGRGGLLALVGVGDAPFARVGAMARDGRGKWQRPVIAKERSGAEEAGLALGGRGALLAWQAGVGVRGSAWAFDARGRGKLRWQGEGFRPGAAAWMGSAWWVAGEAHGCGVGGADAAVLRLAPR